jgi:hypothetical protein
MILVIKSSILQIEVSLSPKINLNEDMEKESKNKKNFYGLTIRYPGAGPVPVPEVYKTTAATVAEARTVHVPHMGRQPTINKPEHVQEQEVLSGRP